MRNDYGSTRTSFRRYLATNDASTAFSTVLDNGILTAAELAAENQIFSISKNLVVQLVFFGAGADNTTFDYRVYYTYRLFSLDAAQTGTVAPDAGTLVVYAGGGTATLSALTGVTGGTAVSSTERFADTLTFAASSTATTPDGPLTDAQTALNEGTAGVYNPAADVPAVLYLPCVARATGIIVDFDMTGATSGNCLILADEV